MTGKPVFVGEVYDHFIDRTDRHIDLVRKYCKKLSAHPAGKGLMGRGESHDESKYKKPEIEPYMWLTWRYKCKDEGVECTLPEGMEEQIEKVTIHHILNNSHHPEFHQDHKVDLLNSSDRDKPPEEIVDATKMPDLDIAEMVADWMAMSEERGNRPKEWVDDNVNVRWKFTDDQRGLIYDLIDYGWG
jgi:hypothetical protein